MKIFHYHPETGALLGEGTADPSPLEPGKWLVPAYATTEVPPIAEESEQVVWVVDGWQVQLIPEPEPEPEPAPAPPAPGPDYLAFWDALMMSTVYASIREQSFTSLPMNTLATEFIALMGDAKAGRPSEVAIQQSINAILSIGTFTEDHLIELQAALVTGNLDGIYVLPTPPE